jgi:hypothetical protein
MFSKLLGASAAMLAFMGSLLVTLIIIDPLQFKEQVFSQKTVIYVMGSILGAQLVTILDWPISRTMIGISGVVRWGIAGVLAGGLIVTYMFVVGNGTDGFVDYCLFIILFGIIGGYLLRRVLKYKSE